jgi:mutator protein MutT
LGKGGPHEAPSRTLTTLPLLTWKLRQSGTHLEGHWEFPGGKVHPSEPHQEALRRELFEELDIVGDVGELLHSVTHAYPEKTVELFFYRCAYDGEPNRCWAATSMDPPRSAPNAQVPRRRPPIDRHAGDVMPDNLARKSVG